METVILYSPIEDKNIQKSLNDSPIWKHAIHEDELLDNINKGKTLFQYKIKFDGLKPVQVTSVKKHVN